LPTQRGVALEDLALKPENGAPVEKTAEPVVEPIAADTTVVSDQPLSDEDIARKYRSDADRLSKEAANLRRMAEELVPTKKVTTSTKKPSDKNKVSVG
jgi:hypothetical protein